ncbi:hypothetical protein [Salinigranum marinum]|uniref:hypothetical protein n=1 Tax=Salinigranum marinum TaxID=1515595 RepID=UPI002989F185|nr:hypothetical protein [Salinigranum marinum]
MQFPGDGLLSDPDAQSTMAVDIDASPSDVWPWLRQLGQDRGGFYSYEWAENLVGLDIHNADRIVAEWQDLSVEDAVRLGRADRFPDAVLKVVAIDPERSLVLQTPDEPTWWLWSFVLNPVDETTTRLLVRSRIRLPENTVIRLAALSVLDPVSFVMTRRMLRGIQSRAERLAGDRSDPPQPIQSPSLSGVDRSPAALRSRINPPQFHPAAGCASPPYQDNREADPSSV